MIGRKPLLALSATGLAALGFAAIAASAPAPVGIAAAVLNRVTIARGGAAQMRPAVLRQQVVLADRVETGARSQLQILLLDRSTFTIGANARLTIDRFVYDPASGRSVSATVAKGAFRFMSGRANRGGNVDIASPIASIGIRGTIVDGVVGADAMAIAGGERGAGGTQSADPQTATLVVLRGPGANTRGNVLPGAISVSASGKTVSLDRPLQAVFVPRSGAQPVGPFSISPSGLMRLQGLIFPSLAEWRLATRPAPNRTYVVPSTGQLRRVRPVPIVDPIGDAAFDDPSSGGGVPAYGVGIPVPSMPRDGARRPQSPPPARRSAPTQEPVSEAPPAPSSTSAPAEAEAAPPPSQTSAPPPTTVPPPPVTGPAPQSGNGPQATDASSDTYSTTPPPQTTSNRTVGGKP